MTMRFRASLFCLATTASFSIGADWTQFRGPNGSGVSTETNLPNEWTSTKNIAWKVNVPGVAWSCPIIVKDQVFVTTAVADGQPKPGGGGGFGGGRPWWWWS